MIIDNLGIPVYTSDDVKSLIYQGKTDLLDKILADPEDLDIKDYNTISEQLEQPKIPLHEKLEMSLEDFDKNLQQNWLMPKEYQELDIETFLVQHSQKQHYQRLMEELAEFRNRNMLDLLKWLKYFVDTCRSKGIVWGVGRGSSVSSYVLYIIGVHKIDPIKYNLDWREFLR
jgi:DNA polymerase III alpha subunit